MPFMSDKEIQKVQSSFASLRNRVNSTLEKFQSPVARAFRVGEIVGGAAAASYVRAQLETRGKASNPAYKYEIFGMEPELLVGAGLIALGFAGDLVGKGTPIDKYADDLINLGSGVFSVWIGTKVSQFANEKAAQSKWLGQGFSGHQLHWGRSNMSEAAMAHAMMHG